MNEDLSLQIVEKCQESYKECTEDGQAEQEADQETATGDEHDDGPQPPCKPVDSDLQQIISTRYGYFHKCIDHYAQGAEVMVSFAENSPTNFRRNAIAKKSLARQRTWLVDATKMTARGIVEGMNAMNLLLGMCDISMKAKTGVFRACRAVIPNAELAGLRMTPRIDVSSIDAITWNSP